LSIQFFIWQIRAYATKNYDYELSSKLRYKFDNSFDFVLPLFGTVLLYPNVT